MAALEKSRSYNVCSQVKHFFHPTFTCSKLTTETITETGVMINFEQVSNLVLILRNISCKSIAYYSSRHLHVLNQQQIYLKEVRNMFKVNNKDTRMASFDVVLVYPILTFEHTSNLTLIFILLTLNLSSRISMKIFILRT